MGGVYIEFDHSDVAETVSAVCAMEVCDGQLTMLGCSALYAHKISTNYWHNVTNPEEFGFASKYLSFFPYLEILQVMFVHAMFCLWGIKANRLY
jgi:hypothetical protein